MSQIPTDRFYTETHEWIQDQGDGTVTVGITEHAQDALGDLVFVELPVVGRTLDSKEVCAVVESVKAASDLYSPISGEVIEVNELLNDTPELINGDAYEAGWIFRLKLNDASELDTLLDATAYAQTLAD